MKRALMISLMFAVIAFVTWSERRPALQTPTQVLSHVPVPKAVAFIPAAPLQHAVQEPVQAFGSWLQRYQAGDAEVRSRLVHEGEVLAQQRQARLYDLIQSNPEAALQAAVPEPQRRLLPQSVAKHLERRINAQGELAVVAASPFPGQSMLIKRPLYREARFGGEAFDAYVYGNRAKQDTKYGTSLQGIVIKDRMAVLDRPARIVTRSELPVLAPVEEGIAMGDHPVPTATSTAMRIVQARGKNYPVCCAQHAAALAARLASAESAGGAFVTDALGGTGGSAPAPLASGSSTTGSKKVLVILTNYSDAPGTPVDQFSSTTISAAYATTRFGTDASNALKEVSYGKLSIGSVTVTGVLLMPASLASYSNLNDVAKLKSDALSLASSNGFNPSSYDQICVVFNRITSGAWQWAGLGDVGGNFTWFNGYISPTTVTHEFCHNYGMRHANLWEIPGASSNPVDPAGSSKEYGDPFDLMGDGLVNDSNHYGWPNMWQLNRTHWLADSAVQTITTSGTYRVYRFDHKDAVHTNTLALKLARTSSTDYWVGYRRKYVGHPTLSDASEGAYVMWGYHDNVVSNLINIDTPSTNRDDASLNVGSTFTDSSAGVSFHVVAAGGSGSSEYLDVQVNFQPRLTFSSSNVSVDEQAGTVSIPVSRANNSTGAVSVHYATANGTAAAGGDYTATSGDLNWADGDVATKTIVVPITADATSEGAETFAVNLSSFTGGAVAPEGSTITVTIQETGAEDTGFVSASTLNSAVRSIALRPDGKCIVGGFFDSGVAVLNYDGTPDATFDRGPGPNIPAGASPALPDVEVVARQADGKVLVGGDFNTIRNVSRKCVARLNEDGSLDTGFDPGVGPNGKVNDIKVQPDGRILVGGVFTTWNGSARAALVRLNEDGSLDTSLGDFNAVADPVGSRIEVNCIALQPVASAPFFRIVVGGWFVRPFSGGWHSGIMALNATNGARDTTFDAVIGAHVAGSTSTLPPVSCIALQPDGKIIVSGQFTGFNGANAGHVVRLTNTGTNDSTFGGGVNGNDVTGIMVQGDGKIVVSGDFTTASGTAHTAVARYSSAGAIEAGFKPAITLAADLLGALTTQMQIDGRLLVGLNGGGSDNVLRRYFSSQSQGPGVVQFTSTSTDAFEGSSATLTVERTGGTLGAISVNYATIARSATADADYTTTRGTLTWAAGDSAPKTINVPVLADSDSAELDETLEVRLGAPVGNLVLGENQSATLTINGVNPATVPHVGFASSGTTVSEAGGSIVATLTSDLSPASSFTIPFTVTGTAANGTDYTISASPVSFGIGETSKDITINITQDSLLESTESITLTLGAPVGLAVLAAQTTFAVSVTDDEALPTINPGGNPTSRIVATGGSTTFAVSAAGNPPPHLYQWRKSTTNLGAATSSNSLTLNNIQLASAGDYNVIVKNTLGSVTSTSAKLGVLDGSAKTINGVVNGNATLTVTCSTNITGFQWFKNGVLLSNVTGHIAGATTKSLVITKLVNASAGPPVVVGDADVYSCVCTLPGAATTMTTGNYTLHVIDDKPDITNSFTLDDGIIGGTYDKDVTYDNAQNRTPTSFSATGLPPGITINAITGKISGKPNAPLTADKTYSVVIKASNAKGFDTLTTPMIVHALPAGSVGVFVGPLARSTTLTNNGNLGGRFDLTTTSTGSFTGKLINGTTLHNLGGVLSAAVGNAFPTGHVSIPRTGLPALIVDFTIDSALNKLSVLNISDSAGSTTGKAWRKVTPASGYLDLHTLGMELAVPNSALPQGTSYASFTVASTGLLTVSGKLADGVAFSTAGHISSAGEVLLFQSSAVTDALVGFVTVTPGVAADLSDYTLGGTLTWSRKQQATTSYTYRTAFGPVDLTAVGSKYRKPLATEPPMGLGYTTGVTTKNAKVTFTDADFGTPATAPDADLLIKPGGISSVIPDSNADRTTTFGVTSSTGAFTGVITLKDVNPLNSVKITRTSTYQGLIIRDALGLSGKGFFLLPNIPALPGEIVGKTNVVSGAVSLDSAP